MGCLSCKEKLVIIEVACRRLENAQTPYFATNRLPPTRNPTQYQRACLLYHNPPPPFLISWVHVVSYAAGDCLTVSANLASCCRPGCLAASWDARPGKSRALHQSARSARSQPVGKGRRWGFGGWGRGVDLGVPQCHLHLTPPKHATNGRTSRTLRRSLAAFFAMVEAAS